MLLLSLASARIASTRSQRWPRAGEAPFTAAAARTSLVATIGDLYLPPARTVANQDQRRYAGR